MNTQKIHLNQNFQGKNILITGASGFLGMILLSMLLYDFPQIGKVHLILRGKKEQSPQDRFKELLQTEAFEPLRKQYGMHFESFIDKIVEVHEGDTTAPNFALNENTAKRLQKELDLIINSAGYVSFSPPVDRSIKGNTLSVQFLVDFIRGGSNIRLLHISTCYVIGARSGIFREERLEFISPQGHKLSARTLIDENLMEIEHIYQKYSDNAKQRKHELSALGKNKALLLGWPNTYTYSKALGEAILYEASEEIDYSIVRPSIIESSVDYPHKGWNFGFKTTSPLLYLIGQWYPFITIQKKVIIDLIPVDITAKGIIISASALLQGCHHEIYHMSTSDANPLKAHSAAEMSRDWFRNHYKKNGKGWLEKYCKARLNMTCISSKSCFSPSRVKGRLEKKRLFLDRLGKKTPRFFNIPIRLLHDMVHFIERQFAFLAKVHDAFAPFTHDHDLTFKAENITCHKVEELHYRIDLQRIHWEEYFHEIHMPALYKYSFSKLDPKKIKID